MKHILAALLMIFTGTTAQAAEYRDTSVPLKVVSNFDVNRYMGRWYEIARFPVSFEKDCNGVSATYSLRKNGRINVVNTCVKANTDRVSQIRGQAIGVAPGILKVSFIPLIPFFFLIRPNYFVLSVSKDYDLAVIGTAKGTAGWILARTPEIPKAQLNAALKVLKNNGYDTSKIEMVQHYLE